MNFRFVFAQRTNIETMFIERGRNEYDVSWDFNLLTVIF